MGLLSGPALRPPPAASRSRARPYVLTACLLAAACHRGASGASPAKRGLPTLESRALSASVAVPAAPAEPVPAYASLILAERWLDAQARLEALPELERKAPEVCFARARVAFELGDASACLQALTLLEQRLPLLAAQIAELRARAQLRVGPFDEAARFFESRADSESLLLAASAYTQAGAPQKALLALERVIARVSKSKRVRSLEVRARAAREVVLAGRGETAAAWADDRWLATQAPLRPEGQLAAETLEKAGGVRRLTRAERLVRASALSEAGRVAETESELTALLAAPGAAVSTGKLTFLRAQALYVARGNYTQAAELFERAAREEPSDAPRALFLAARSLSRAQLDERAINGYEQLARQFPKSSWAEQAAYLSARLHFIAGKFARARKAYDAYLARVGDRGRFVSAATYERALCDLEDGAPLTAAPLFARLASRARDARARTRFQYLEALARSQTADKTSGVAAFSRIAQGEPLSFFGLAARARLQQLGVAAPPLTPEQARPASPAQVVRLPPEVALLGRIGLARDAEAALVAHESEIRRSYAPRGEEALCEAYGMLGVATRRYRVAQDAVRAESLASAPNDFSRWAWRCIYPTPYAELAGAAAGREQLDVSLLFAVMRQESAFDPEAVSAASANGLLQLIEPTARRIADSFHEPSSLKALLTPDQNIRYGARYLSHLSGYFGGQSVLVAAAYNAGPDAVFRWLGAPEKVGIDAFVARIPFDETRVYVERVIGNLARYQYLAGGASGVTPLPLALPPVVARPDDLF